MSARRFAPGAWRGALGGLTCYDEVFDAAALAGAMDEHSADAALLVGADWALVDPALCDEVIRRHRENPAEQRLTFTQAPPGLAGACIARSLVEEIRDAPPGAGAFASIGGLLGYLPMRPTPDRIAKPVCVGIDPGVRDLVGRWVADTPHRAAQASRVIESFGGDWPRVGLDRLAAELRAAAGFIEDSFPAHTVLRGCARRATAWLNDAEVTRPDAALTLEIASLDSIAGAVAGARAAGFAAVHVRTGLDADGTAIGALLGVGPDVISVDLLATTAEVYESLTGSNGFERVMANVERLLEGREDAGGVPMPWIVPRITRRDAVYEQIERFYDYWLCRAGAAVIDPAPADVDGERIAPLTVPEVAATYAARTTRVIDLRGGA